MAQLSQPTLDRLIKEVRTILRQPVEDNSTWANSEITMYLGDAVKVYFLGLVEKAEGQFDKTQSLDVVANVETVALPTDCFKVKILFANQNGIFTALDYINNLTEDYSPSDGSVNTAYAPSYYFRGNSLVLRPIPTFSQASALKIEYTAFPEVMLGVTDTLDSGVSPVFKELIVAYTVYKCKWSDDLVNGGNTSDKAKSHLANVYAQFEETVTKRSFSPQYIKPFNP